MDFPFGLLRTCSPEKNTKTGNSLWIPKVWFLLLIESSVASFYWIWNNSVAFRISDHPDLPSYLAKWNNISPLARFPWKSRGFPFQKATKIGVLRGPVWGTRYNLTRSYPPVTPWRCNSEFEIPDKTEEGYCHLFTWKVWLEDYTHRIHGTVIFT